MTILKEFAPAKLNLYLHVTGKRPNGYHELDSLVAFCSAGDEVCLQTGKSGFAFALDGPQAAVLSQESHENNLVVRAARSLADVLGRPLDVEITLTKKLPIASGIGGGSSDAAAALRLLARHWGVALDAQVLFDVGQKLGQDIPCCIESKACYFGGLGEILDRGPVLPPTYLVLANPGCALPTASVFKARRGNFSTAKRLSQNPKDATALAAMLQLRGNDLTEAACGIVPEISSVLDELKKSEACLLARMSGSGATCFGLYAEEAAASRAASKIANAHSGWWVSPAALAR